MPNPEFFTLSDTIRQCLTKPPLTFNVQYTGVEPWTVPCSSLAHSPPPQIHIHICWMCKRQTWSQSFAVNVWRWEKGGGEREWGGGGGGGEGANLELCRQENSGNISANYTVLYMYCNNQNIYTVPATLASCIIQLYYYISFRVLYLYNVVLHTVQCTMFIVQCVQGWA